MYPEKHEYVTVVPQLYGPADGFVLALVTVGGLLHWQTSVWTEVDHINNKKHRHFQKTKFHLQSLI